MNILFFIHNMTGGGAERVMSIVANELVARGYNVTLASVDYGHTCVYDLDPRISYVDLRASYPKASSSLLNKVHRHTLDLFEGVRMRRLAKKVCADIIVSFGTALNNVVLKNFKYTKYPVIVSEHTNVTRNIPQKIKDEREKLYTHAAAITVLTKRDYELWKNKFPNVEYLTNPFIPQPKLDNIEKRKVVFTAGRIYDWKIKGYDLLIEAWAKVCDEFPDWKLEIAGEYNEKSYDYLQDIIAKTKAINIEFLGFRKDILNLMASSEVYCLSSRVEGLPMTLLEAMSVGCCCVSFDCETGPNEIIQNGKTGLLARAEDVNDLADKLRVVMLNNELRKSLADNSSDSLNNYSLNRIIDEWVELLNKLKIRR